MEHNIDATNNSTVSFTPAKHFQFCLRAARWLFLQMQFMMLINHLKAAVDAVVVVGTTYKYICLML
jgi:hypothetical protein